MEWAVWMLAVAILGLAAVASTGRLGEMPATVTSTPAPHVPDGILDAEDLRSLRFAVVTRGYSMQQVDEVLARLARQLDPPDVTAFQQQDSQAVAALLDAEDVATADGDVPNSPA